MNTTAGGFNINYYPPASISGSMAFPFFLLAAAFVLAAVVIFAIARHKRRTVYRAMGVAAFCIGIAIALVAFYKATLETIPQPVFSPRNMLTTLWENYKKDYIDPTSKRTVDTTRDNVTTSEGESYTMLRATWMDDEPTFDASWQWTQANLEHSNDHLFSWLYGKRSDGTMGVLIDQGGQNAASDADTDIALALVFAYSRWQNEGYLRAAVPIISDIWTHEVKMVNGKPVLLATDVASIPLQEEPVNPSYFSPYAYKIFAVLDPTHDWTGLTNNSYVLLDNSMRMTLDKTASAGLPPDWIVMNAAGEIGAPNGSGADTNFGFDALRVPWRIALDWEWNQDPRAEEVLSRMGFLSSAWSADKRLYAIYAHDGTPVADYESPSLYGGALGYFIAKDPKTAQAIYLSKLQSLYNPDTETWKQPLSYYDSNIAWFGMALYNQALPNLFSLNAASGTPNYAP